MAKAETVGAATFIDGLKSFSVEELDEVIAAAQREREAKVEDARRKLRAEFEERAAKLNLSVADVMRTPENTKTKIAPRYRGPEGEEWAGRGKPPKWLEALEGEGRHRSEFKL